MLEGIDISQHQPHTPSLTGKTFCFARASIGLTEDTAYAGHVTRMLAHPEVVRGAYHFNWSEIGAADQARFFVAHAHDAEILALDVEGVHGFTKSQAEEFIAEVHRTDDRPIGLYHSAFRFFDAGQDFNWVADWTGNPPSMSWTFWQYSSMGAIDGMRIDLDRFDGDQADLNLLAGRRMNPLKITSTKAVNVTLSVGDQLYNPDGSKLVPVSVASTRPSPYEVLAGGKPHRVIQVTTGGSATMALVRITDVQISPMPPADCTTAIAPYKAALDARTTALRAIAAEAADAASKPPTP